MRVQVTTLNATVESAESDDGQGVILPHVVLRFGDSEVVRWRVPSPDRWIADGAYDADCRSDYAERFVADKLAELFTGGGAR